MEGDSMIQAVGRYVVVKTPKRKTRTPGGIFLPDNARQDEGVVVHLGPLAFWSSTVEVGATVLYGSPVSRFEQGDEEYVVVRDENVYAVLAEATVAV